jgi:transposase
MQTITTIGLDIAKSVFQVHGVDAQGKVIVRRQLKRRYVLPFFQKLPPCLVGIEACASSHYWSRELQALGHTVRLMPPAYVKPYVKRQKNDSADAEAICEAVTLTIADANSLGAVAAMRTRMSRPSSISMAGRPADVLSSGAGATTTSANPDAAVRSSWRQR